MIEQKRELAVNAAFMRGIFVIYTCTEMHTSVHQHTPAYTSMCKRALVIGVHQCAPAYTSVHPHAPAHALCVSRSLYTTVSIIIIFLSEVEIARRRRYKCASVSTPWLKVASQLPDKLLETAA